MNSDPQQTSAPTTEPGIVLLDAPLTGSTKPLGSIIDKQTSRRSLRGLGAVSAAVDALPRAEDVAFQNPVDDKTSAEKMKPFRLVRNVATGTPFYVAKEGYAVINVQEALHPLLEACQEKGLVIAGDFTSAKDGARIKGSFVIGNPEAVVEVQKGDVVLMGFNVEFRHDGTSAVRLQPSALRLRCLNGMVLPELLPSFTLRHVGDPIAKTSEVAAWLDETLQAVPSIAEKFRKATQDVIEWSDLVHAALGAGLSYRHALKWAPDLKAWEPEATQSGMTVWAGYNALTAFATHSDLGATEHADRVQTLGAGILDAGLRSSLIAKGKDKAAALQAERAKQQADPKARKTIEALPGIVN